MQHPQGEDRSITSIHYDSRQVKPGGLFVAIKGLKVDGHDFISHALDQGAAALVMEKPMTAPCTVPVIRVNQPRKALALLGASFYDNPSSKLHLTGITGTNGKTSTSYLLEAIFNEAGHATGVIGTINYRYGNKVFANPMTTPESLDIQQILADMVKEGITHVIMEISSHAVDLDRIFGLCFDTGVFTNLSQDHLDYHQTMDHYFDCKKRFFTEGLEHGQSQGKTVRAVINGNDDKGLEIKSLLTIPFYTTGSETAHIRLRNASLDILGIQGTLICPDGQIDIRSDAIGAHNLENILNAAGAALCAGVSLTAIKKGVEAFTVPGRLERVPTDLGFYVFVDYAHTPDGLLNVLQTLKPLTPGRLITVFGCGGDRDKGKRPKMGQIAETFSDLCIVTSDNPRSEEPDQIIDQIREGMKNKHHCVEPDRRKAIGQAIDCAKKGDCILIAGKGHETYQILKTRTIDFDDRTEARKALETHGL